MTRRIESEESECERKTEENAKETRNEGCQFSCKFYSNGTFFALEFGVYVPHHILLSVAVATFFALYFSFFFLFPTLYLACFQNRVVQLSARFSFPTSSHFAAGTVAAEIPLPKRQFDRNALANARTRAHTFQIQWALFFINSLFFLLGNVVIFRDCNVAYRFVLSPSSPSFFFIYFNPPFCQ